MSLMVYGETYKKSEKPKATNNSCSDQFDWVHSLGSCYLRHLVTAIV